MDAADALVFALLALADLALIAFLRKLRKRREQSGRVMKSMKFAIQREIQVEAIQQERHLRRA
jgi:hypothetical protein